MFGFNRAIVERIVSKSQDGANWSSKGRMRQGRIKTTRDIKMCGRAAVRFELSDKEAINFPCLQLDVLC
jgi:hypothetical protein